MNLRRLGWRLGLVGFVHAVGGPLLVDHGIAGALLAGGGGPLSVATAALFLVVRLLMVVGLAALPVLVVDRCYGSFISKIRGGLGSPSK